jgi:hypothetical protein
MLPATVATTRSFLFRGFRRAPNRPKGTNPSPPSEDRRRRRRIEGQARQYNRERANRKRRSEETMARRSLVALALALALLGTGLDRVSPAGAGPAPSGRPSGYWMLTLDGRVHAFGGAAHLGAPPVSVPNHVDIEPTPTGNGYRILSSDGTVRAFGSATHLGDGPPLAPGETYVSMSATPVGDGYWLFTSRGRVAALGSAVHHGDMAGIPLNAAVLDSVATPSGRGYWMVGADGGIFSFGDAVFSGSTGHMKLNQPIVSMTPDPDGSGYWLVASDGGIFAFDASFYGSMGAIRLNKPVTGMVGGRRGYLMVAEDGGIFAFGDNDFHGSLGDNPPTFPVVAVALLPGGGPPPPPPPLGDPGAPDTRIDAAPSDPASPWSATFSFSSTEAGSTFACRLDAADPGPCASPLSYPELSPGLHTFEVRAVDASGRPDPTPAVRSWTVQVPSKAAPYELLVADHRNNRLLITDLDGNLLWKFDNPTGRTDLVSGPLGVSWLSGNRILATFAGGDVGLIDVATKTMVWRTSGYHEDWFLSPYEAALLPDGNLAVALRFNEGGRVDVYDPDTGGLVWRHLLSNAHSVKYRTPRESYNTKHPTLLIGGWGATREVAYAPGAGQSGQTVTWNAATEYTHDAVVVDQGDVLTTEGYYIQRINRAGTPVWRQEVPVDENGQRLPEELRRVAVNPLGGLVYSGAEANRIEFRDGTTGLLDRSWSAVVGDGSKLNYPYGIQIIRY